MRHRSHPTHPTALVTLACLTAWTVSLPASPEPMEALSLAGTWRFGLDRLDSGLAERWHERALDEEVRLPGSLAAQGIGDDITASTKWTGGIVDLSWFNAPEYEKYRRPGSVKVPFWLQPEKHYVGPAWYQRDIEVPAAWKGWRVELFLERPHWETRVWVDGDFIGAASALATPHEHDLRFLEPGKHRLTIRVDNRLVVDVGHDSHSVSDHTQGNWNGIAGRIELRPRPPIWIDGQRLFPKNDGTVRIEVSLRNALFDPVDGTIQATVREKRTGAEVGKARAEFSYPRGTSDDGRHILVTHDIKEVLVKLDRPARLWSEFSPELYEVQTRLEAEGGRRSDVAIETFGFREIATEGTQFVLNGRKIFIRGTLECCIFPRTGHPPTDVEGWKRIIGAAKAHGLNSFRFHSWCPPEAAFIAADELGFYFHVECSSWANSSTTLGDGKPIDRWIYEEADRILRSYGNHPSFLLMNYGNEPGGPRHAAFLAEWVNRYKGEDPRRLYTSASGWPQIPENQFHVTPDPRIQAWGDGLKSRINALPPETRTDYRDYIRSRKVPVISHEIGQWCVYPNFDEIPKYTGYLKPKNFEIFRDFLSAHGMGDLARPFLLASGKLQVLCYKEEIESALRTPGMGGFQLLDLHDFPGQGTALVGVLDPFWEEKGYVTAAGYSRFSGSTVPLARLSRRVFTGEERLEADLEVAHFGPAPLEDARTSWKLMDDGGKALAEGELPSRTIPVDNGVPLGSLSVDLRQVSAPARLKLVVAVTGATPPGGRPASFENDWDIWVYPPHADTRPSEGVKVVDELAEEALASLESGGKVLLLIPPGRVKGDRLGKVALAFSSIFWNTAWTRRQPPHTLGILCDPRHPALADFPTDFHTNWQWWYLVSRAGAMILDGLPRALRPTVHAIDDWFTARKLGLVFEAKIGKGKLLVTSIDLKSGLDRNPVARQLLHSLLHYMAGDRFQPEVEVAAEAVRALMTEPSALEKGGVRSVKATSAEEGFEAEKAIDGDPGTMWHTAWTAAKPGFPHEIAIELVRPIALRGFRVLPRQDGNRNGWIKDYAFYSSDDSRDWGEPLARGSFPGDGGPKVVELKEPRTARFIRLVALSGHSPGPFASLAELEVMEAGK